jgi:hypothetical protein
MAAIFDFALLDVRTDDIVARLCGAAIEKAFHHLVDDRQPGRNAARVIGGIVTAAGFPEFGIPIALAGHLLGGWLAAGKNPPVRSLH